MALRTDRLKALREGRGWSQRELARRCGFALSMISQYESNIIEPSVTYLAKVADQLGVSMDYLWRRSDDPGSQTITIVHELNEAEQALVSTYRKGGWYSVIRFGADQLEGKGEK